MKKIVTIFLIVFCMLTLVACSGAGPQGPQGEQGIPGEKGVDGSTVLTGEGAPSSAFGNDNDSYIDLSNWDYYVKENGEWAIKGNIKGKDGINGQQGAQGEPGEDGHTPQVTIGDNGNWYIDGVDTNVSAKGDEGKQGEKGDNGVNGKDGTSVLTGNGEPSADLGRDGDSYINLDDWNFFVKENEAWNLEGNIKGADVDIVYHTVTFDSNGGNESYEPQTIKHGEKVTKPAENPTRNGYTFVCWSYQDEPWSFVGYPVTEDMTITATWSINVYELTAESSDSSKGTVSIQSGSGIYGETVTLVATPNDGYLFKGWYEEGNAEIAVSKDLTYTFSMPAEDRSLIGYFYTQSERDEETQWNIEHGVVPTLSADGKTLTYGLYPQTHVSDAALISALDNLAETTSPKTYNGWYLYDNEYYAKCTASTSDYETYFSDGTNVKANVSYWFKCEPITWNVIGSNDGEYKLVSALLLDKSRYLGTTEDGYAWNNYEMSGIRKWLNESFYNSAFALNDEYIQISTVANGAETIDPDSESSVVCGDTEDKVFLLSYQECAEIFANDEGRRAYVSDWTIAKNPTKNSDYGAYTATYWTRSPYLLNTQEHYNWFRVSFVNTRGEFAKTQASNDSHTIRPAITLNMG